MDTEKCEGVMRLLRAGQKIDPSEIAEYFLQCYKASDPTGFTRIRDAYMAGLQKTCSNKSLGEQLGLIRSNLHYAASLADKINYTKKEAMGESEGFTTHTSFSVVEYYEQIAEGWI